MNPEGGSHEVTPAFRAHLEWQIESALRRETRFAAPVGMRVPRLAAIVVVIAALACGGIAVAAAGQLQESKQRDLLIESAKSEEALIRLRVDLARADYEEAKRRFEVGTTDREALLAAEQQLRELEAALARVGLDIEEIRATSAAPRNDLQAPLVGERDFVRERLTLELETAQHTVAAAERAVADAKKRVSVGIAPHTAHLHPEGELVRALAHMQRLRLNLELRGRALKGEVQAEEIAATIRRITLTLERDRLRREMEISRKILDDMRTLVDVGRASQLDLKRAEVALLEHELELKRIIRELELVGSGRRE